MKNPITIAALLSSTPKDIDIGLDVFLVKGLVPEISDDASFHDVVYQDGVATGIETYVFHHKDMDVRRFWRVAGIKFKGVWVMAFRCAGRSGNDHVERWVLDAAAYREMIVYALAEIARGRSYDPPGPIALMDDEIDLDFHGEDVTQREPFYL